MNKILVIQTAYLGDVILATPVISELKRIFPDSNIDFLLKSGNELLLKGNPNIRYVYVLNKSKGKYKSIFENIRAFRSNKYDLLINLHRYSSSAIISMFSGAKQKHGFKKNALSFIYSKVFPHQINNRTHEVERNLSLIRDFGANKRVLPKLYPQQTEYDKVKEFKKDPYICIAPSSVWKTKQFPIIKWLELIRIIEKEIIIYLVGASDDYSFCEHLIESNENEKKIINLAGKLSILETAALFKDSERVYVNDSAPLHIASAMNTPVTAFFCSTVPDFGFYPLSDDSVIMENNSLDCRPCGIHGHKSCPLGHFKCALEIRL